MLFADNGIRKRIEKKRIVNEELDNKFLQLGITTFITDKILHEVYYINITI
jgi:hypothetical protein